eukprot:Lankesteria_metandrocarpae@DN3621_c1_g1_i1.p1
MLQLLRIYQFLLVLIIHAVNGDRTATLDSFYKKLSEMPTEFERPAPPKAKSKYLKQLTITGSHVIDTHRYITFKDAPSYSEKGLTLLPIPPPPRGTKFWTIRRTTEAQYVSDFFRGHWEYLPEEQPKYYLFWFGSNDSATIMEATCTSTSSELQQIYAYSFASSSVISLTQGVNSLCVVKRLTEAIFRVLLVEGKCDLMYTAVPVCLRMSARPSVAVLNNHAASSF